MLGEQFLVEFDSKLQIPVLTQYQDEVYPWQEIKKYDIHGFTQQLLCDNEVVTIL